MSKKVVWSLFDSEYSSMLDIDCRSDFDVYCFGVGTGTRHISLDLSDFETAKIELDKYPKPDYVFAFPPCETWCLFSVGNKRFFTSELGINLYWRKKWVPFDFLPKYSENRLNGINTAITVSKIIHCYKPKFWAVENGTRSLLFAFLSDRANLHGYRNLTNYYSYGFDYLKPTTIYSNALLSLKKSSPSINLRKIVDIRCRSKREASSLRSRVPVAFYSDILFQFNRGFLL